MSVPPCPIPWSYQTFFTASTLKDGVFSSRNGLVYQWSIHRTRAGSNPSLRETRESGWSWLVWRSYRKIGRVRASSASKAMSPFLVLLTGRDHRGLWRRAHGHEPSRLRTPVDGALSRTLAWLVAQIRARMVSCDWGDGRFDPYQR